MLCFRVHVLSRWHPETLKETGGTRLSTFPFPGSGSASLPCAPQAPRIPGPGPTRSGLSRSKPQSSHSSPVATALCPVLLRKVELVGTQGVIQIPELSVLPMFYLFQERGGRGGGLTLQDPGPEKWRLQGGPESPHRGPHHAWTGSPMRRAPAGFVCLGDWGRCLSCGVKWS